MVLKDGSKMSKSKGNTIDPQELIDKYGADTVRLFVIFAAPVENSLEWSENGVEGAYKFLNRLWFIGYKIKNDKDVSNKIVPEEEKNLKIITNKAIAKITDDYGKRISLNTIVSTCMDLLNNITKSMQNKNVNYETIFDSYRILILLLNPITPHICHEISDLLKIPEINNKVSWPKVDKDFIKGDSALIVVQVNGKVRKKIEVDISITQKDIEKCVLSLDEVKKYTDNKAIKKIIYIKEKLVNIVV